MIFPKIQLFLESYDFFIFFRHGGIYLEEFRHRIQTEFGRIRQNLDLIQTSFRPPPQRSWTKAKTMSIVQSLLTVTAWVQFLPAPTHETCLCCSAVTRLVSSLMKLACLDIIQTSFRHYLGSIKTEFRQNLDRIQIHFRPGSKRSWRSAGLGIPRFWNRSRPFPQSMLHSFHLPLAV